MTDTARYADLILPAPYMVETEDLYTPYGYRADPVCQTGGASRRAR